MSDVAESSTSAPIFKKKRAGRAKDTYTTTSVNTNTSEVETAGELPDDVEDDSLSVQDLIALRALRNKPSGVELDRLNRGETRKKKKKKQEKSATQTEEDRWAEQMQMGGLVKRQSSAEVRKSGEPEDVEEDEEEDEEGDGRSKATAPRLVKQNNFQGETGTIDVDKHMMAYIEEEMKKRRQQGGRDGTEGTGKSTGRTLNPDDELYSIAEKYRQIQQSAKETIEAQRKNVNAGSLPKERDENEEGNATLSSAMLNGVPEVDLGIDHRMKNIEETERAKRAMQEAQKVKNRHVIDDEDGDFASARFFKYGTKIQSDADILRTAETLGFNTEGMAADDAVRRQPLPKRQTATDDAALERFKKRQRNQLKT